MQWILQDFEDTQKLAVALDQLGYTYSWHKVVPFVGELLPEPRVSDLNSVVLFGSYSLWKQAKKNNWQPGVFQIDPFVQQEVWHPFLLNGADAKFVKVADIPSTITPSDELWFLRPVDDSKSITGTVKSATDIIEMADTVLTVPADDIPLGSLRHDTEMMLTAPVNIAQEWRVWVVEDCIITASLYKQGSRVVYKPQIDEDALAFAGQMVAVNPNYAQAYVIDVCRTSTGLKIIETNCINAAGFYAADLEALAKAINGLTCQ